MLTIILLLQLGLVFLSVFMVHKQNEHSSIEEEVKINHQKIWDSVSKNYEMVQGAQLSNSFVILMALNESEQPLTTTQISEIISKRSKGQIYKNPATLKDALEKRLKREGYVNGIITANKFQLLQKEGNY